jgi:hypothetical protein
MSRHWRMRLGRVSAFTGAHDVFNILPYNPYRPRPML